MVSVERILYNVPSRPIGHRAEYRLTWERLSEMLPERQARKVMVGLLDLAARGAREVELAQVLGALSRPAPCPNWLAWRRNSHRRKRRYPTSRSNCPRSPTSTARSRWRRQRATTRRRTCFDCRIGVNLGVSLTRQGTLPVTGMTKLTPWRSAPRAKSPAEAGLVVRHCVRYCLRPRRTAMPARPKPSRASVPGSGTAASDLNETLRKGKPPISVCPS